MILHQILWHLQAGGANDVMIEQLMDDATDLELLSAILPFPEMDIYEQKEYFKHNESNCELVIAEIRKRAREGTPVEQRIWWARLMAIFSPVITLLESSRPVRKYALKALVILSDPAAYEYLLDFQKYYLHHKRAGHDKTLLDIVQMISGDHSLEAYEEAMTKPDVWRLFLDESAPWYALLNELNLKVRTEST
jgi:hypothetical protein